MIFRTPTYYRDFRCIAGDCRDSCCKGWEIDIDKETAAYYAGVGGSFGERLRSSIRDGSFLLTADERCPFLNKSGLCDIYTELGGDKLCRICSDHPRYFEWFGSVKEGGVGLCCEAAAELIVSRPFALCEEEVPDETASGEYDEELFSMLIAAREEMFAALGLPQPNPVPLMKLHHQVAQKLHAVTDRSQNRPHDLIDLQLIFSQAEPDLRLVKNTCVRLFAHRRRQPWPSEVVAGDDWDIGYSAAKYDLPVLPTVEEAVSWANELIARIDNA